MSVALDPETDALQPRAGRRHAGVALYLDLMKRCLTNWIYGDWEAVPGDAERRAEGKDWPATGHTMVGLKRLDNIQACVEDVLARDVPGDLIETGVWRGGATIFMRSILKAYGVTDRRVWVADPFEGLPPPNPDRYPSDRGDNLHTFKELAVPLESVRANFERYGLLDDQVQFLKGWFRDTLPRAPIDAWRSCGWTGTCTSPRWRPW